MRELSQRVAAAWSGVPTTFEPHIVFKEHALKAIALIRNGDKTHHRSIILGLA